MLVAEKILIRNLGTAEYQPTVEAMREFTARRGADTPDELWLLEHPPVYTLGLAADPAHGPKPGGSIPVLQVERGGEITYHGPGQVVLYALVDLARRGISEAEVRDADEVWITSSSKEVLAIVTLDGKPVAGGRPGPVFRRVYALYQEFKQKVMRAGKERQAA